MAIKIFGKSEQEEQDIYLKFDAESKDVAIDVVTKEGGWIRTLLYFTSKGLILCSGAEETGFPTTKQGKIKVVKS